MPLRDVEGIVDSQTNRRSAYIYMDPEDIHRTCIDPCPTCCATDVVVSDRMVSDFEAADASCAYCMARMTASYGGAVAVPDAAACWVADGLCEGAAIPPCAARCSASSQASLTALSMTPDTDWRARSRVSSSMDRSTEGSTCTARGSERIDNDAH